MAKLTTREIHVNTFKASEVFNKVYRRDIKAFAKDLTTIQEQFGHPPVSDLTIVRYCNAGQGYEEGPPGWFVAIVNVIYEAYVR